MDQSSVLITGSNGQLGSALSKQYPKAKAVDSNQLDITDSVAVSNFDWSNIKYIINAAAYTNVDGAQSNEGRVQAWSVNAVGVANLARVAKEHDITLVHISSEYVFDGSRAPHTEDEPLSPLGVYAQTKAAADIVVTTLPKYYIVRTSWVIGDGKNFVRTMLDLGKKGIDPTVIADDTGRPTFTGELVRAIDHLLTSSTAYGLYNCSNEGEPVSWANLTRATFECANLTNTVTDITNEEYYKDKPEAAPRPHNSVFDLSKLKATDFTPHDWKDDLKEYVTKEMNTQ